MSEFIRPFAEWSSILLEALGIGIITLFALSHSFMQPPGC